MTERYTHPNQEQKKRAVELLVQKSTKKSEKSDDLAHICHTEKSHSNELGITAFLSMN